METKICKCCGRELPVNKFAIWFNKKGFLKHRPTCIACVSRNYKARNVAGGYKIEKFKIGWTAKSKAGVIYVNKAGYEYTLKDTEKNRMDLCVEFQLAWEDAFYKEFNKDELSSDSLQLENDVLEDVDNEEIEEYYF